MNDIARMHSRKHGKHGSNKPAKKINPAWLAYDRKETEKLIVKLAKEGKTSSEIGFICQRACLKTSTTSWSGQ